MNARSELPGSRRAFWTRYQPGMRVAEAPLGSAAFFDAVEAHRYRLEPDIPEIARFQDWRGRDVLEAGCGIGTDAMQFVRAGARYTGLDFSPTALELAQRRTDLEGAKARFVLGSVASLPFPDDSFDLVYSNGVIHHLPETGRAIQEFHRVLRDGGTAIVMVYHRASLNFYVSVMTIRRLLAAVLLVPGAEAALARLTGEQREVLADHHELLRRQGWGYLANPAAFLSHNTDGPGNPLSKVYSAETMLKAFSMFADVHTQIRFLNLRAYPLGERLEIMPVVRRLGRRWGWHLWITAHKVGEPAADRAPDPGRA
jgi:SAM-dependent methyltransferase